MPNDHFTIRVEEKTVIENLLISFENHLFKLKLVFFEKSQKFFCLLIQQVVVVLENHGPTQVRLVEVIFT